MFQVILVVTDILGGRSKGYSRTGGILNRNVLVNLTGSSLVSSLLGAVPIAWMIGILEVRNKMIHGIPSRELTDPTLGKGKSSSKVPLGWGYVSFRDGINY